MLDQGDSGNTGNADHTGLAEHHTSVLEKGAFAMAHCSCGWLGPARRARSRARADADSHTPA
ncbi:hypothetical protein [Streptomyces sp. SAJ15]|uniref:hypothetical protein n=1 Tax=Streptomyces sp. SAJ15 TaxID=2011095 RepID=UPI0011853471|nr:hypothetical protein [Streptomyces sp. SAJ15]TVL87962.1 hypothetical protein CD790_31850 [Streptomyces sp. SAJ15]